MLYSSEQKVKDARLLYYKANGIALDGGVSEKISKAVFGPLVLYVPNFPHRVAALQRHDLDHILLNADTSIRGEAIVGGFETASGCGEFWIAWFLEPQNIIFGLILCPKATFNSFLLGRRSQSLFRGPFREEWLEMTVGELRKSVLADPPATANGYDLLLFILWTGIGFLELIVSILALASPFVLLFLLVRSFL
jgi:hypothetical protein